MEKIKHHPILFSTPMVQANLENRKTKTRRTKGLEKVNRSPDEWSFAGFGTNPDNENDKNLFAYFKLKGTETWLYQKCPYNVGDVLWVRETTKVGAWNDDDYKMAFDYKASPELLKTPWVEFEDIGRFQEIHYKLMDMLLKTNLEPRIDEENERIFYNWEPGKSPFKWTPSIFMPKEACRIFLKIKSIRAERLQDISEEDAIAEGAIQYEASTDWMSAKYGFQMIWETINGKESWCFNPFVWVYEFERIEKPLDFI